MTCNIDRFMQGIPKGELYTIMQHLVNLYFSGVASILEMVVCLCFDRLISHRLTLPRASRRSTAVAGKFEGRARTESDKVVQERVGHILLETIVLETLTTSVNCLVLD